MFSEKITFVPAETKDYVGILEIYNHYVINTPITFDLEIQTIQSKAHWFKKFSPQSPYLLLIAKNNDEIIAYACSHPFAERPAYQTSVEFSIYTHHQQRVKGVARHLYQLLFQHISGFNIHRVYAGISIPNDRSVHFHQQAGFNKVAHYSEVGFKFEKYWDVAWFEKKLI